MILGDKENIAIIIHKRDDGEPFWSDNLSKWVQPEKFTLVVSISPKVDTATAIAMLINHGCDLPKHFFNHVFEGVRTGYRLFVFSNIIEGQKGMSISYAFDDNPITSYWKYRSHWGLHDKSIKILEPRS